jgi:hypothetical protein
MKEEDIVEEGSASPVDVLRADAYPQAVRTHLKKKNANLRALINEKLRHLEPYALRDEMKL